MKVISKFHDYYDSCMKFGIDKSLIYLRESKDIVLSKKMIADYNNITNTQEVHGRNANNTVLNHFISFEIIGFCGKIYNLIRFIPSDIRERNGSSDLFFYDYNEFEKYIKENNHILRIDLKKTAWRDGFLDGCKKKLSATVSKEISDIFHKEKVPVFVLKENRNIKERYYVNTTITLNPKLSDYGFYKVKDTFSAYQEISQYISGVLGVNKKDLIEVSNKDQIIKKGFDLKTSFRNPVTFRQLNKIKDK